MSETPIGGSKVTENEQRGTAILPNEGLAVSIHGVGEVIRTNSTYVSEPRFNVVRASSEYLAEDPSEIQEWVSDEEIERTIQNLERYEIKYWIPKEQL